MKTHQHIHLQKTCKLFSMESRNNCHQDLDAWGPADASFAPHARAQGRALPPRHRGEVETGHGWPRVTVPGAPDRQPPGRAPTPRRRHSTAWHSLLSTRAALGLSDGGHGGQWLSHAVSNTAQQLHADVSLRCKRG